MIDRLPRHSDGGRTDDRIQVDADAVATAVPHRGGAGHGDVRQSGDGVQIDVDAATDAGVHADLIEDDTPHRRVREPDPDAIGTAARDLDWIEQDVAEGRVVSRQHDAEATAGRDRAVAGRDIGAAGHIVEQQLDAVTGTLAHDIVVECDRATDGAVQHQLNPVVAADSDRVV